MIAKHIGDIWQKCHEQNWGGNNEKPISLDTAGIAHKVFYTLPVLLRETCEAKPKADGSIEMEWKNKSDEYCVFQITSNGTVYFKTDKEQSGQSFRINNGIPLFLTQNIEVIIDKWL
jgi:hypothetical protein